MSISLSTKLDSSVLRSAETSSSKISESAGGYSNMSENRKVRRCRGNDKAGRRLRVGMLRPHFTQRGAGHEDYPGRYRSRYPFRQNQSHYKIVLPNADRISSQARSTVMLL